MSSSMERRVIKEFIDIYRSEPSLWQVRSNYYNNRAIKNQAYRRMVAKLRELYPGADVELVRRKINALRTNYRKEQRKVEASRERSRLTGEPVYVPSLWYFELFHFIGDQEAEMSDEVMRMHEEGSRREGGGGGASHLFEEGGGAFEEVDGMSEEFEEEFQTFNSDSSQLGHRPEKRKRESPWLERQPSPDPVPMDCSEAFGRYVAAKLRIIEPRSRMLCERLISEVLFRGESGDLTERSCISDTPFAVKLEE